MSSDLIFKTQITPNYQNNLFFSINNVLQFISFGASLNYSYIRYRARYHMYNYKPIQVTNIER